MFCGNIFLVRYKPMNIVNMLIKQGKVVKEKDTIILQDMDKVTPEELRELTQALFSEGWYYQRPLTNSSKKMVWVK